jgi:hypothetical protein
VSKEEQSEFDRFDQMLTEILKVPHSAIKSKLDEEKKTKEQKKKRKPKTSASGREASDKG